MPQKTSSQKAHLHINIKNKKIKNVISVFSGKGGVGKTTVAVNLALALSQSHKVGLLDIDIHGPNTPAILGLENEKLEYINENLIKPVEYNENLVVVSTYFLLESQDKAIIWRSPLKHKLIEEFLSNIAWPELDFLIVDFPPGTGDECLSFAQLINIKYETNHYGIIVAMPTKLAILDAKKAIDFAKKLNIKLLGIVENFKCEIFNSHELYQLCKQYNLEMLSSIEFSKKIHEENETGKQTIKREFIDLKNKILEKINNRPNTNSI